MHKMLCKIGIHAWNVWENQHGYCVDPNNLTTDDLEMSERGIRRQCRLCYVYSYWRSLIQSTGVK